MSRIGIRPIDLPAGVEVKVDDKNVVTVKGPKGELQEKISKLIKIEQKDGVLNIKRDTDEKEDRSQHGLARSLISNMVGESQKDSKRSLNFRESDIRLRKKETSLY